MKKLITTIGIVLCIVSCGGKKNDRHAPISTDTTTGVSVDYAHGFSIRTAENHQIVTVYNPWKKGEIYARYFLVKNDTIHVPSDGVKVKIPLQTLAAASVTHLEFLSLLNEISTLTGFCSPHLAYNVQVQANVAEGKITDLGDPFSLNVEATLLLKPDALMMSGYNHTDANAQRVQQAGIPVIYNNEWMETSLLGRAEWIKFVAAFFDKTEAADSIFTHIETRYKEMQAKAASAKTRPKILAGNDFRGTWYMPAGRSFMGRLFEDAGGDYFYANDTTTGSLPLNMETVLKNFADADVWINCNYNSIAELTAADRKYALFRPVKTAMVYNFNKRRLPSSANDFWESAVARPDLLLGDVIATLHPELLPGWEFVYTARLEP